MITVHLVLNSHIDPIWLWPWQAGLDAVLATCRSACDRIDRHPEIIFTRGEAWVYDMIERTDAQLFQRIRRHVKAGRWEIVGGWWIQPDCNLPSGFAMDRQIELGKAYFLERFKQFPRVAYNVDTFGHAATLPSILRAHGQDRYIMMRPQEHEMKLPARLFRWREAPGSPEVVTFRIAGMYLSPPVPDARHIQRSLTELPPGVTHTMCFLGVGDHGGGPTEKTIAWVKENRDAISGCRLEFSSPSRFFEAIAPQIKSLPVVTGELQYHAIGCYSVYRPIKTAVRKAEHLVRQAQLAHDADPEADSAAASLLEQAWRHVAFGHFHDVLGGSCVASAVPQVDSQLGHARSVADDILQLALRRRISRLPGDPLQRIVLQNVSDGRYENFFEFEPWLAWAPWEPHWRLLDEKKRPVRFQLMQPEAVVRNLTRLTFHVAAKPNELRVFRIDKSQKAPPAHPTMLTTAAHSITSPTASVSLSAGRRFSFAKLSLALPRLDLIEDLTDTWSHGTDRYLEKPIASAEWEPPVVGDKGPVMASLLQEGRIGNSPLSTEYRIYDGASFVDLLLRVHWMERHKILKLTFALPKGAAASRTDGILGGELQRPNDAREYPLRDRTLVPLGKDNLGIVCPEVFALDATPRRIRLTLLRSPLIAHHDPQPPASLRAQPSDQGIHEFRFRIFYGPARQITSALLDQHALNLQRPLLTADATTGMPA